MDWDFAIERYRLPLLGIIVGLFAEIGLTEGGTVERLSKPLYRFILRRLRTAEAAVRRLIIVAARDIVVEPEPRRPAQTGRKAPNKAKAGSAGNDPGQGGGKAKRKRGFLFKLFDPPRRFKRFFRRPAKHPRPEPRVTIIDLGYDPSGPTMRLFQPPGPPPAPPAPVLMEEATVDDDTVDARHLIRRMLAIKDALEDLPRQALRLARWRARLIEERHPQRESALRPGRPPGFRKRPIHQVDEILKECHWLARNAQPDLDTS